MWLDVSGWDGAFRGPGYAIVEGTFSSTETGHMGMWPGAIIRLERIDRWPPAVGEEG